MWVKAKMFMCVCVWGGGGDTEGVTTPAPHKNFDHTPGGSVKLLSYKVVALIHLLV